MFVRLIRKWTTKFRGQRPPRTDDELPINPSGHGRPAQNGVRGDSPILLPDDDAFGVNPFAKAIANSISAADASEGLVYAINGAWGSGKSSAVNLILHHLSERISDGQIVSTSFNPWWFSGAEALTLSFFQEMRATVGKSLDEKAREAMANLGSRLSSAGPLLGGIASLLTVTPAAGAAVVGGTSLLEKLTRIDSTVENEQRKLAEALAAQNKKFLIVIDDIDRLNTDDALLVFKLVKSVGRLPNVIYLMAFDRTLAEKMVAERFPAEGASYLEKIVQGAFDLPIPDSDDLKDQLLKTIENVMGAPSEERMTRFWNIFYDAVTPLLKTPRDAVRLSNAIKVSWPAIANDVDRADFLAIEAMRLFLPASYQAVRDHPDLLTGPQPQRGSNRQELEGQYNKIFLEGLASHQREVAKRTLRRLFPRLDAVWSNVWSSHSNEWERDRLICSPKHFRTYFAFSITNDGITSAESDALIANAGTPGATASALRGFLAIQRKKGGTRAALALDELNVRAEHVAVDHIGQFVKDLFSIADDLNVEADQAHGFSIASNTARLHWLLNNLLRDRLDLPTRSQIILNAAHNSSLEWLVNLADRCNKEKNRVEAESSHYEPLVDGETADQIYELSLSALRSAAEDGTFIRKKRILSLLYRWRDRDGNERVRDWTDVQLESDDFIVGIANDAVQESWSQGIGGFGGMADLVARKNVYIHLEPLTPILDVARFRQRVLSMLASPDISSSDRTILERFRSAPERNPDRIS